MKKQTGITLIALIVTIIVLLILAGVGFGLALNQSGVISRSKETANVYRNAENKEKSEMESTSELIDQFNGSTANRWIDNGNFTFTKGETTVKVGDYVNYNYKSGDWSESYYYASLQENNGCESVIFNRFDINKTFQKSPWRVLGVDEEGRLLLLAADSVTCTSYPVSNHAWGMFRIQGKQVYLNVADELNKVSEAFGHGEYAYGARSVNLEDIQKLITYNEETDYYSHLKTTTKFTLKDGKVYIKYEDEDEETETNMSKITLVDGTELEEGKSIDLSTDEYYYSPGTVTGTIYTMIFRPNISGWNDYWLATPCKDKTYWGIQLVASDMVDVFHGYDGVQDGSESDNYAGVRPVVILESGIDLKDTDGDELYEIQGKQ